jgi:hypothetical protein
LDPLITSAKQAETRARRIKNACSMLTAGKRRRLLLRFRSLWLLQQELERSETGNLDEY